MKNLKKVLSLALAFAMVLGLCVTGMAAEDVTTAADWDEVTDKDAALLLNAFEIMEGSDEDGVLMFNPDGDVTRAQAAAMISRALWGGKDTPELYANGNAGAYIDVDTAMWYMGYVNYMTVIGVMTGDGDGEFRPDGNVTGYELLKMCLVAVGYDADTEGLTGLGWDLRTMALATQRGYNDLTADTTVTDWNAPLSRMNAAIIISNMIYREMVTYDDGKLVVITDDTLTPPVEQTFGTYMLGMLQRPAILLANQYGSLGHTTDINPDESTANAIVLVDTDLDDTFDTELNVNLSSTILDLGTFATVYFVDEVSQDGVISAAVNGATVLGETKDKETGAVTNADARRYENSFGTTLTLPYAESVSYDIDNDKDIDFDNTLYFETITEVTGVAEDETYGTVYLFNDKKWDVEDYEDGSLVEGTDLVLASKTTGEAVEGSMIMHTTTVNNAFGGTYTFAYVLGEVEGKVTTYKGFAYTPIYIDGVAYYTSGMNTDIGVNYGSEGIFYLDPTGSIIMFSDPDETTADPTYAVIYEAGFEGVGSGTGVGSSTSAIVEVAAVLEDGTKDTFQVNSVYFYGDDTDTVYVMKDQSAGKLTGTMTAKDRVTTDGLFKSTSGALYGAWTNDGTKAATPMFVEYTLNNDGTINLIFNSVVLNTSATMTVTGSSKTELGYLTKDTVTFVLADSTDYTSWKAVIGTGLAAGTYTGGYLTAPYLTSSIGVSYMMATTTSVVSGTEATFFYIVANNGVSAKDDNGNNLYEIVFFDADTGKIETIETTYTVSAGTYWETLDTEDGQFSDPITAWEKGFATTVDNGLIEITKGENDFSGTAETAKVYTLTKDTVYYLIDGEDSEEIELSDLSTQKVIDGAAVSGTVHDYYETMVYANASDEALIVIVYAETQSTRIGTWDGSAYTPY